MSLFLYEKSKNRWSINAPERLKRPEQFNLQKERLKSCPFCERNEALTPHEVFAISAEPERAMDATGWLTRVVPNRYHALQLEEQVAFRHFDFHEEADGFGVHEVIIESPRHDARFNTMSIIEVENYFKTLRARLRDLSLDTRLQYLQLFKNSGAKAGATLEHPHTQLIGLPFIPPLVSQRFEHAKAYMKAHKRAYELAHIEQIIQQKKLLIAANDYFALYCPEAPRHSFEMKIAPRHALPSLGACEHITALSELFIEAMHALHTLLGADIAYNLLFDEPPININLSHDDESSLHFTLSIVPRIYQQGGFELSSDIFINVVSPFEAARLYKEVLSG